MQPLEEERRLRDFNEAWMDICISEVRHAGED